MNCLYFVFPHVGKKPIDKSLKKDLKVIDKASWNDNTLEYLNEARRILGEDDDRVKTAETKGRIYLALLVPIIGVFISITLKNLSMIDKQIMSYPFTSILLVLVFLYATFAVYNSWKALKVTSYQYIDIKDFIIGSEKKDSIEYLVREILKCIRENKKTIDHKIDYILVTEDLIVRMIIFLYLALITGTIEYFL